jgi:hypothetical protein
VTALPPPGPPFSERRGAVTTVADPLLEDVWRMVAAADDTIGLGFAPNATTADFAAARVFVATRPGGGVLVAMAHGVPVVALTEALAGLPALDRVHLLTASDPASMAGAIVALHRDAALWTRLAGGGRAFVAAVGGEAPEAGVA